MLVEPLPPSEELSSPGPGPAPLPLPRARAAAEVVLCSGFPTQLIAAVALALIGVSAGTSAQLSPTFIFALSIIDTALLLGLIFLIMRQDGDSARGLFLGPRPIGGEIAVGVAVVPFIYGVVFLVQVIVQTFAPHLRNVPDSPFGSLLSSPWLLAGFSGLGIVAGGLREELQRAFLLNRFERALGGPVVGVVMTSIAFGLGHTVQGWDAAIITGLLGATWGVVYLSRRSAIAPVASHALFNLGQIAAAYVIS